MAANIEQARAAQQRLAEILADAPQVNGIGITRVGDGFGLKLNLTAALSDYEVPPDVDGVAVRTEIVGPAVAY
jgi:hypothetical protein